MVIDIPRRSLACRKATFWDVYGWCETGQVQLGRQLRGQTHRRDLNFKAFVLWTMIGRFGVRSKPICLKEVCCETNYPRAVKEVEGIFLRTLSLPNEGLWSLLVDVVCHTHTTPIKEMFFVDCLSPVLEIFRMHKIMRLNSSVSDLFGDSLHADAFSITRTKLP